MVTTAEKSLRDRLRVRLRLNKGEMSVLGSERSFDMPVGRNWAPGEALGGYYIDFSGKCESAHWPPYWLEMMEFYIAPVQWALGALEHYLDGEGDEWLAGAKAAGEYLISHQHQGGPQDGGWQHQIPMPHSYRIDPPWLSAITQGEAASLLVRLYLQTGEQKFAEAARKALAPMQVPVGEGGTLAFIEGSPVVEEYPSDPPSGVLNGAIFGIWGFHDVAVGLGDAAAQETFERLVDALVSNLHLYDTGYWSRYDIYPHPIANPASPAYHALHVKQLQVLSQLAPRPELEQAARRFEGYRASRVRRVRALTQKIAFRLLVPRNPLLAHRLPWNRSSRRRGPKDLVVLAYHAVSPDWPATLSVTPQNFSDQIGMLARRGYRGVTFSEAVRGAGEGKVVAVTFDDGYRSVFDLARPILDSYGMPATLFVPTELIDGDAPMAWPGIDNWLGGEHEDELVPMSWQQARELADSGWEIGSHTRTHPRLSQTPQPQLEAELTGSRGDCERRLERRCESIAYPYGDHDDTVIAATAAAGYSAAATLPAGEPRPTPLAWPRIGVYYGDSRLSFRLKVSPTVRRLRRSRAWMPMMGLLRRVRRPKQ